MLQAENEKARALNELEMLKSRVRRSLDLPHFGPKGNYPLLNVYVSDKEVVVLAEMPGYKMEDVCLTMVENVLAIECERTVPTHPDSRLLKQERFSGHFRRSIELPYVLELSEAKATLKDGYLKVVLPRSGSVVRRISVI